MPKITKKAHDVRLQLPPLGEYHDDILTVDAWISNQSKPSLAILLLKLQLQQREPDVKARIEYLAKKRGVEPDDLWLQILKGEAEATEIDSNDINS